METVGALTAGVYAEGIGKGIDSVLLLRTPRSEAAQWQEKLFFLCLGNVSPKPSPKPSLALLFL